MKKHLIVILFLIISAVLLMAPAPPYRPPPYLTFFEVDDGEKVFIMLYRERPYEQFLKTGLYYNTEPYEAVYTTDVSFSSGFFSEIILISECGLYIIVISHGWLSLEYDIRRQTFSKPAIIFYGSGKLIRSYHFFEVPLNHKHLLSYPISLSTASGSNNASIFWFNGGGTTLCSESNILSLCTRVERINAWGHVNFFEEGSIINFDITTGKIISDEEKALRERAIHEEPEPEEEPEPLTTADALAVLNHVTGISELSEADLARFDMNGDGVVDTADALIILRIAVGLD